MKKFQAIATILAGATLAACDDTAVETSPGLPAVGSEYDLSSFEGARAGQAEMGIQNLGYQAVRTAGLTTWWFNPDTGACAQITTSNGRYSSVTMLPSGDC